MDFDFKRLTECNEPFFGIVPSKVAYPMGRVSLPVMFGTEENFRTKYLSFKVPDFKSSNHAILGRPMLARFMAVTHYTYLVLKMTAPHGVPIVYGDLIVSFKCDNEALEMATTNACFHASAVMVTEAKKVFLTDLTISEQNRIETALDATPATKKVCLSLADPPRWWSSMTTSGRNRNSRSPVSSRITLKYSHGAHRICQVSQGSWLSTPWM
jgi:hypothetical protein